MKIYFLLILTSLLLSSCASDKKEIHPSGLMIEEVNPDKMTALTKQNLLHLAQVYDLSPFLFTKKVRIEQKVIPTPYPVLTINTRNAEKPRNLLSVFLHEELHWWLDKNPKASADAINELKKIYPKAPQTQSYGKDSTYLHLIVCYLELRTLEFYLGKKEARNVITDLMKKDKIYPWIYYQILFKDFAVKKIVNKYKLLPPPLN